MLYKLRKTISIPLIKGQKFGTPHLQVVELKSTKNYL